MIYVDIVRQALQDMPSHNLGARRVVYEQLRTALKGVLDGQDPPLDPREKVIELRLLEITIRRFEVDLRAGTDVTASDYVPDGLEQEQTRLYAVMTAVRITPAPRENPLEGQDELMATLSREMRSLSNARPAAGYGEAPFRLTTVYAVLLRVVREFSVAQGKLGLFLFVGEPIALIWMLIAIYSATGQSTVMNMDLTAFSITGVVPFMLVRMTTVRVAVAAHLGAALLSLPPVRIYTLMIGQALVILVVYSIVMVATVALSIVAGNGSMPQDWVRSIGVWGMLWLFGVASGVTIAPCYVLWHSTARIMLIVQRVVSLVSAVAFVSEQLPSELKIYLLWNPLLHGIQSLRSVYFSGYKSEDASLAYFAFAIGVLLSIGAVCERFIRPRIEPA